MARSCIYTVLIAALFFLYTPVLSHADDSLALQPEARANLRISPLNLRGGSTLTLISPTAWSPLAKKLSHFLTETHESYSQTFGEIPPLKTTVRLMDSEVFYKESGAPRWTNAMYYRNQITIPLAQGEEIDLQNLYRSVRHEYTHAVVNSLSGGRCPGWLDEGLAQWAEGVVNPALEPALKNWLRANRSPLPLSILQGGFTKLDIKMVPTAYAQSLFAAKSVINTFGFNHIRGYFESLRSGQDKADAFKQNFRVSDASFEKALAKSLNRWTRDSGHLSAKYH